MSDLNNDLDLRLTSKQTNSAAYALRQTKKKNYKKIINLLIENGAKFSSNFITTNGMCKLLTQIFSGPNKDADFVHFLNCINYLFKFKVEEFLDSKVTMVNSSILSSLNSSQESLLLMIAQKGAMLGGEKSTNLAVNLTKDLNNMLDEFFFKIYLVCLRVIKDYKGACLNYYIDTLINLHYSRKTRLNVEKLAYLKEKNSEIHAHFGELVKQPVSLKSLCADSIRKSIRFYGINKINSLDIPSTLKYEIFFNSISKGYCINYDYYSYFLYKEINKLSPV